MNSTLATQRTHAATLDLTYAFFLLFIYLPLPTHSCPPAPTLLRTLACFPIQLAGTSVENRKRDVYRRWQSRPGRQQLLCRAGSFPIRVSETQEEKAIVRRDSRELGFITHRYRHRPARSVILLFSWVA